MGAATSTPVRKPQDVTLAFSVRGPCCKRQSSAPPVGSITADTPCSQIDCRVHVEEIIKISEEAGKAILAIYNSPVRA
jgi:hypothetical protein